MLWKAVIYKMLPYQTELSVNTVQLLLDDSECNQTCSYMNCVSGAEIVCQQSTADGSGTYVRQWQVSLAEYH